MSRLVGIALWIGIGLLADVPSARGGPPVGFQSKVKVQAPTRIDWTFALASQSLTETPADWLPGGYDSTKQQYDLFVPPNYNPKQSYPVVLFIAPGGGPGGWKEWEAVCKQSGIIFAAPYDAGNDCPGKKRVRICLDVLDDLRRNYSTDPDRTYITGFSGGGRIACAIGFALPEYFGGIAPVCAGGELRDERWLMHRLKDRLSVAFITGESDFNRGEVERLRGPLFSEIGVRTKVWTVPKMGHAVPGAKELGEVFKWLEEGLPQRQQLAKKYPASRVAGDSSPTRDESSKALLQEGMKRIEAKETLYSGLMVLQGCMNRWKGLPASTQATKILLDYENKTDLWEDQDIADKRKLFIAQARSLSDYATGNLPQQYAKERPQYAKQAIELWTVILKDGQDAKAVEEAKKRLPELQKLLGK